MSVTRAIVLSFFGCGACASGGVGGAPVVADALVDDSDSAVATDATHTDGALAPPVDASHGALACGDPRVLSCDGFDAPAVDVTKWTEELGHGTATLDDGRWFRGGRSLHVRLEAGGGRAYLRARSRVNLDGERLFGRVHMYVPASAAPTLESHSNVVAFGGRNAIGATSVHAVSIGARAFFGLYFQDDPLVDESSFVRNPGVPITKVPLDRWFCLEWEVDGIDDVFRLHLDGALVPSSVIEGRAPATEADVLLGAEFDLAEAWFDEFALSRERVGCLNPDP